MIYHQDFGKTSTKELNPGILPKSEIFSLILGYFVICPPLCRYNFSVFPQWIQWAWYFVIYFFHLEIYHEHIFSCQRFYIFHWFNNIPIIWLRHDLFNQYAFLFLFLFVFCNKIIMWWRIWPTRNTYPSPQVSLGKGQSPCLWLSRFGATHISSSEVGSCGSLRWACKLLKTGRWLMTSKMSGFPPSRCFPEKTQRFSLNAYLEGMGGDTLQLFIFIWPLSSKNAFTIKPYHSLK